MKAQFYNMNEQVDVLIETFRTPGNNALFYGRGGYAKTALLNAAAKYVSDNVYHMQANSATDESTILGTVSIKKLMQDDLYEYNAEGTLTVSEVAVLDEMLDMPGSVMTAFKAVLFDGKVCTNAGTCTLSNLKHALGATNVNPEDWVEDGGNKERQSRQALLARFHFVNECVWQRHTEKDYQGFLKNRNLTYESRFVKLIMEMNDVIETPFSPRDTELMLNIWNKAKAGKANPLKAILYYQKMNSSCRAIIQEYIARGVTDDSVSIRILTITDYLDKLDIKGKASDEILAEYSALKGIRDKHLQGAVTYEYVKEMADVRKRVDTTMESLLTAVTNTSKPTENILNLHRLLAEV